MLSRKHGLYADEGRPVRVVDLFCGGGGLALGAHAAGLGPTVAFDIDPVLTSSMRLNFPRTKLFHADLAQVTGREVEGAAGGPVTGVFGGPPCQAFSDIGHRRSDDPRRELLSHFFRIVAELRPAFFVMENVRGLAYADTRPLLDQAMEAVAAYDILGPMLLDAADYGAATRRRRLFVVGVDRSRCDRLSLEDVAAARRPAATVRDAIEDLATACPKGAVDGFDIWKLPKRRKGNAYRDALRSPDALTSGHRRTAHSDAVLRRFQAVEQGGLDRVGRHPRLAWNGQCPTLRAGTGDDHGGYQAVRPIHPDEARVITVREAARLQGFPDHFRFHPTVWHSFRMIGNSVSPVIAAVIFGLLAPRVGVMPRFLAAAE